MSLKCIMSYLALLIIATAATAQAMATSTADGHGPRFAYLGREYPTPCIYQYRLQPSGAITPLQPSKIKVGSRPTQLIATPSGQYAYVPDGKNSLVFQCKVGPTGQLTLLKPPSVPGAPGDSQPVMTPNGKFLYFLSGVPKGIKYNDLDEIGAIIGFRIASNGTLHPIKADTILVDDLAQVATIDLTGRFPYVLLKDSSGALIGYNPYILQYRILPDGTLRPLDPAIVQENLGPEAIAMAVDTRDRILFVSYQSGTEGYRIGADGRLSYAPEAFNEDGIGFTRLLYDDRHHVLCGTANAFKSGNFFLCVYHLKRGGGLGREELTCVSSSGALTPATSLDGPGSDCELGSLALDEARSRLYAYDYQQSLVFVVTLKGDGGLPVRAAIYNPGATILGLGGTTRNLILL